MITHNLTELSIVLPAPALRALRAAGYTTLEEVLAVDDSELLKLHGVGPKALRILRELQ